MDCSILIYVSMVTLKYCDIRNLVGIAVGLIFIQFVSEVVSFFCRMELGSVRLFASFKVA